MEYKVALKLSISILSNREKRKLLLFTSTQTLSNLLDLLGVISFSTATVLATQKNFSSNRFIRLFPILQNFDSKQLSVYLFSLGFSCLLIKSLLSFIVTKKTFMLFAKIQQKLSKSIFSDTLKLNEFTLRKLGGSTLGHSIVDGAESIIVGVLGGSSIVISELSLLILLLVPIYILAPYFALFASVILICMASLMHNFLGTRNKKSSNDRAQGMDQARNTIRQMSSLSKIVKVRNRSDFFSFKLSEQLSLASYGSAKSHIIQQVPKYVIEVSIVAAGILVGTYYYLIGDMAKGVGAIALMLIVSFRIIPSFLRLQGAFILIKSSLGQSSSLLDLVRTIEQSAHKTNYEDTGHKKFRSSLPGFNIKNISFSYSEHKETLLDDFSLQIFPGQLVLLKGPSGSGKTTLVDILLGLLECKSGQIQQTISRKEYLSSYMSQETILVDGAVWENISLQNTLTEDERLNIIEISNKLNLFDFLPNGLETIIGSKGMDLSGGQSQKIGLARAIFGNPSFIVFDEPTSSLDVLNAKEIAKFIKTLKGSATIILITHGNDFDNYADQIIYFTETEHAN